jgi:hypothetical protein
MPSSYSFDYESVQKIKRDHEQLKNQYLQLKAELAQVRATQAPATTAFFKTTSVVDASDEATDASGSTNNRTFGEGNATLMRVQRQESGALRYELKETNQTNHTIYNFGKLPIPSGFVVPCYRLYCAGIWVVQNPNQTSLAVAPTGGISARSGTTAGSADCVVYYLDSGACQNAGSSIRVYNWSQTAVTAGAYITIKQVGVTGEWVVDAEDCAP